MNQPPGLLISEIYLSRQGEGLLTGTPSLFVRTSGCNLRCSFCDTPFASWKPEGQYLEVPQILQQIDSLASDPAQSVETIDLSGSFPIRHVVITGGEPMVAKNLPELCQQLHQRGFHITVETAGTLFRELPCDLMSISPKFSNSTPTVSQAGAKWHQRHETIRFQPQVVQQLVNRYDFQLKFVVDSPADLQEILDYLQLVFPGIGWAVSKSPANRCDGGESGLNIGGTSFEPVENEEVRPLNPTAETADPLKSRILLMPQGTAADSLLEKQTWLEPLCREWGFVFCPRSHIHWYGNRRGT